MFSLTGMKVTAFDTLEDAWHKLDGNQQKILDFAHSVGIEYYLPTDDNALPFLSKKYDVIMSHDVLEHFHSSPRVLMNKILQCLKPNGILAITVPNAANLRKRLHLLAGKTNYNKFEYFYWYPGMWNGHVREYVKQDLQLLNQFLNLELLELSTYHLHLDVLPAWARPLYTSLTCIAPGFRDSWMLISRKPEDWSPKFKPNSEQYEKAFRGQYFDYSQVDFDWEAS
jgi:SAM-dependent methyltransferase